MAKDKLTPADKIAAKVLTQAEQAAMKAERSDQLAGKKQDFLIKLQEQNNVLEKLKSTGEAKAAAELSRNLLDLKSSFDDSNNLTALDNRLAELATVSKQSAALISSEVSNSSSINSLTQIADTLKQQTADIELQTKTDNVTSKSIDRLLKTTVAGDANVIKFQEEFVAGQAALKIAMETGDSVGIDLARAQLDAVENAATSEEDRREAIKKQDESNSLLLNMSDKLGSMTGKVAKTGGFLAGIVGLATLFFDPETFATIVRKAMDIFSTLAGMLGDLINGDFESLKESFSENVGLMSGLINGGIMLVLPKVLVLIRKLKTAFTVFSVLRELTA